MNNNVDNYTVNIKEVYEEYLQNGYKYVSIYPFDIEYEQTPEKLVVDHMNREMYLDF